MAKKRREKEYTYQGLRLTTKQRFDLNHLAWQQKIKKKTTISDFLEKLLETWEKTK